MSLMYREAIIVGLMILISLLVVAKSDKQIVHILEGKLFKRNLDISIAESVYSSHKRLSSTILFMAGFTAIAISVILIANGSSLFPAVVALSVSLLGLGIWGRIKSFRAADSDLDNTVLDRSARHR